MNSYKSFSLQSASRNTATISIKLIKPPFPTSWPFTTRRPILALLRYELPRGTAPPRFTLVEQTLGICTFTIQRHGYWHKAENTKRDRGCQICSYTFLSAPQSKNRIVLGGQHGQQDAARVGEMDRIRPVFPLNCHQTCEEEWDSNETRMGELSELDHQQSTRHFGEKQKLNHQRSSWHLFAYNLLCCLQLQRQRIGLHPGWLEDRFLRIGFTTWDWKITKKKHGASNADSMKNWPFVSKNYIPGNDRNSIVIFFNEKSLGKKFLEGNTCHLCENKWMLKWMDALVSKGLLNH